MDVRRIRIEEIKPYENNPRIIEDAIEDVKESIRQCGYISPIIVDEDLVILAGHTRYNALVQLGYEECDVAVVPGLSEEQRKKYRLYDNKTGELAKWDMKLLGEELAEVDFDGYDFGQPVADVLNEEPEARKKKTCPCCGEVFYV